VRCAKVIPEFLETSGASRFPFRHNNATISPKTRNRPFASAMREMGYPTVSLNFSASGTWFTRNRESVSVASRETYFPAAENAATSTPAVFSISSSARRCSLVATTRQDSLSKALANEPTQGFQQSHVGFIKLNQMAGVRNATFEQSVTLGEWGNPQHVQTKEFARRLSPILETISSLSGRQ
jgi:hypothetical protein